MNFDQNPPNNQPSSSIDNQSPQEINPPQPRVQVRFNGSKPVVIYIILAITILAYLFQAGSKYLTGIDYGFALGGKVNELITQVNIGAFSHPCCCTARSSTCYSICTR